MIKKCPPVVLQNFFEPCALFLLMKKPDYGYELSKQLKKRCHCQTNVGNLYRGLNRMVKAGLITKKTAGSEIGPKKSVYTITAEGKHYLSSWITELEKQNIAISELIKNYKKTI